MVWYATLFRSEQLEQALKELAPTALRYNAISYSLIRSKEDRYSFIQTAYFEDKLDFERYWEGPEFTKFRFDNSGWYQIPISYEWYELTVSGAIKDAKELATL